MFGLLLALHIIICLCLIAVVLVQSGKGGGLTGGAFGGTAQTVFGGRGATDFITRATMVLGGAFFLTSLTLALMSSGTTTGTSRSLIQEQARRTTPATRPAPGATPPGSTAPTQQPAPGGAPSAPAGGTAPPPAGTPPATPGGGR